MKRLVWAVGAVLMLIALKAQAQSGVNVWVRIGQNSNTTFLATVITSEKPQGNPHVFSPGANEIIAVPAGGKLTLLTDPRRQNPDGSGMQGINGNISVIVDLAAPRTYASCNNKVSSGTAPVLRIGYIANDGSGHEYKECKPGDATQQTIDAKVVSNVVNIDVFDPDKDGGFQR